MNPSPGRLPDSLSKRLAGLSPERRALLLRLMREEQSAGSQIQPRDRRLDPPPVTYAQEQLWFLDRLAPGNWFYNESTALHLKFAANPQVLQRALNEIARRHESIRTTFGQHRGELVQIIAPHFSVPLTVVPLLDLPEPARSLKARQIAADDAQAPFDLEKGPLIRTILIQLGPSESIFLVTMHHIIFDGWSFTILLRELSEIYEAFAIGRPSPLPDLPIQYADFAAWQRRWLKGEAFDARLHYWKTHLAQLPTLELPTDHPRPAVQSFRGSRHYIKIPRALHNALQALSAASAVTPFMTLLTAFKTLLIRYTGQEDIVVGVPVASRGRIETEGLIGFFVNTLVMRTDLSGNPPFAEALGRVRKVVLEAFENQDVPFEKLVQELQPRRDLSRNPLFQITFQLYGTGANPADSAEGASLQDSQSPFEVEAHAAKFDLRFDLSEHQGALQGFLEYDTALFESSTIERIASHFLRLLEGATLRPNARLSELPLLSKEELHHLIVERNQTHRPYPRDARIESLFEQQALQTPLAVALTSESESLTFAGLNSRANRIANLLKRLGVAPGSHVGIAAERSPEIIAGILAILKAGAAYVPFDPEEPPDRTAAILRDAEIGIILTVERQLTSLASQGFRVLALRLEETALEREPNENLPRLTDPLATAYVLFTSGSTGRPKGVRVPHRAVVRLVCNSNFFSATPSDVFLQFAPLSFDASTFEIWGPLLHGAQLALFPPHQPDLAELADFIRIKKVSVLWLTAALFHHMVDFHIECFHAVRHLLAGGDVLSPSHVEKFRQHYPGKSLSNGYGPTENTTFTCVCQLTSSMPCTPSVPIGTPIANSRVYLLDPHRAPVPLGVIGELFAAGDGLASGYLNRPDLTAKSFLPDPFDPAGSGVMYATGDRARYRHDGQIEFHGRLDNQIKIRGFRVELEEIEFVLRQHPAIRDAACTTHLAPTGDRRIAACILLAPNFASQPPSSSELRRHAEEKLPDYLVPTSFMVLDAFPVNANGKILRSALPAPDDSRPALEQPRISPQTPAEHTIAQIWQEVLSIRDVGIHDNFFDLGGHSLLAVLLHNRLKEAFPNQFSIVDLFRHPTVAALARILDSRRSPPVAAPSGTPSA